MDGFLQDLLYICEHLVVLCPVSVSKSCSVMLTLLLSIPLFLSHRQTRWNVWHKPARTGRWQTLKRWVYVEFDDFFLDVVVSILVCVGYIFSCNNIWTPSCHLPSTSPPQALTEYKAELRDDPIISTHLTKLYDNLLEQNLIRVIEPFSRVQVILSSHFWQIWTWLI